MFPRTRCWACDRAHVSIIVSYTCINLFFFFIEYSIQYNIHCYQKIDLPVKKGPILIFLCAIDLLLVRAHYQILLIKGDMHC